MKRSRPLKRSTIQRRTRPAVGQSMTPKDKRQQTAKERKAQRKRINPVSDRRAGQQQERRDVVAEVLERDGHRCRARDLGGVWGDCSGPLTGHEVVKRSAMRDAHVNADVIVTLCWRHNGFIEDHPTDAKDAGLTMQRDEYDQMVERGEKPPWLRTS